ncbi:unnamed protein product, partial [Phaeothamnion confervicola]
ASRQIVITGVGCVTSVGVGAQDHFEALLAGKSGIAKLPSWADEYPCQVGSLVKDFDPAKWMDKRESRRQARYTHLAMASTRIAVEDAKLDTSAVDKDRFGILVGSGVGGVEFFEENCNKFEAAGGGGAGLKKVSPFLIPALISNTASGIIAIELGARGPNYGVVSACATGTHAIGTAMDFIYKGQVE